MNTRQLLIPLFASLFATTAWADVEINETNFPDENFRNWVLSQTYGSDGVLTEAEIAGVTSLIISSWQIQSLEGIEFFTALTDLNCGYSGVRALDLSKNTALRTLNCYSNYDLSALDISGCTALTTIQCGDCGLTTLDVSKNSALNSLDCHGNQLMSLDVSACMSLTEIYCPGNQLMSLDVSGCTSLIALNCYGNQLTALDVSNNTALASLSCYKNQLTALDVSKNTALKSLSCENNQLKVLDVSKNTILSWLACSGNQLTKLDVTLNTQLNVLLCSENQIKGAAMDALIEGLPAGNYKNMGVISNENEGNVMTTTQVAAAKAKGWTPEYYNGKYWQEYAGSDPNGIKSVVRADKDADIWNLSGQRITRPRKGLFIIGGRKVVVL